MQLQHIALTAAFALILVALPGLAALPSGNGSSFEGYASDGATVYFVSEKRVWATDGTPEGTRPYAGQANGNPLLPTVLKGTLYYFDSPSALYAWSASENRQRPVWDVRYGRVVARAVLGDRILFFGLLRSRCFH